LTLDEGDALWEGIQREMRPGGNPYRVDLSGVERMDGAGSAMLLSVKDRVEAGGGSVEFVGGSEQVKKLLLVYGARIPSLKPEEGRHGLFEQVGTATRLAVDSARDMLAFMGDLVVSVAAAFRAPRTVQWADIGPLMERAGADGVPIVLLINFSSAHPLCNAPLLEHYGANLYVRISWKPLSSATGA
jgi:phospholipid/cholesterol/gamma-HCH transport system permease protein